MEFFKKCLEVYKIGEQRPGQEFHLQKDSLPKIKQRVPLRTTVTTGFVRIVLRFKIYQRWRHLAWNCPVIRGSKELGPLEHTPITSPLRRCRELLKLEMDHTCGSWPARSENKDCLGQASKEATSNPKTSGP